MDVLGFGSHLIIDGYGANALRLEDEAHMVRLLERLAGQFETVLASSVQVLRTEAGMSAALVLGESHLTLHAYKQRRVLSLGIFSRKTLDLPFILGELTRSVEIGRYESYLGSRSKIYPQDPEEIERLLRGDRSYTSVRLDDTLFA